MIPSYLSLVIGDQFPVTLEAIKLVDRALSLISLQHEIVLYGTETISEQSLREIHLTGPLTHLHTHRFATEDEKALAALGRAVGDHVLLWRGPLTTLSESNGTFDIGQMLTPFDARTELLFISSPRRRNTSQPRAFSRILHPGNGYDPGMVGIFFSRRVLQQTLARCRYERSLDLAIAQIPLPSEIKEVTLLKQGNSSLKRHIYFIIRMMTRTTNVLTRLHVVVISLNAIAGLAAIGYATFVFWRGGSPEGWVTLMVYGGIAQTGLSTMIFLIWRRAESLNRDLTIAKDPTIQTDVFPPKSAP